jgi:DNA-binding protein
VRDKKGRVVTTKAKGEEGVTLKATGFAICAALNVGNVFLERGDVRVEVRTTSVEVVDDVVDRPEGIVGKEFRVSKRKKVDMEGVKTNKGEEMEGVKMELDGEEEEVDMVTRVTSGVEIFICRKKEVT